MLEISGTDVISSGRGLQNITSIDTATTNSINAKYARNSNRYNGPNIQFRYGSFNSTSDNAQSYSFATAFSTACYIVVVSMGGRTTTKSRTGFTYDRLNEYAGTYNAQYLAIGY